jgi:hypothetical protein
MYIYTHTYTYEYSIPVVRVDSPALEGSNGLFNNICIHIRICICIYTHIYTYEYSIPVVRVDSPALEGSDGLLYTARLVESVRVDGHLTQSVARVSLCVCVNVRLCMYVCVAQDSCMFCVRDSE